METVIFKDGEMTYRQQYSFSENEEDVLTTLPLDSTFWSEFKEMYKDKEVFIEEVLIPELEFRIDN